MPDVPCWIGSRVSVEKRQDGLFGMAAIGQVWKVGAEVTPPKSSP